MVRSVSSEEAEALLNIWEESEHRGRVWRAKRLYSSMRRGAFVSSSLAHAYFEEARVCWICGAYVSTILMTQLAFEEEQRTHYRLARGAKGELNDCVGVDQASFFQLIQQAEIDGLISSIQAKALHRVRKSLRNPYVHTKNSEKTGGKFRRQRGFERNLWVKGIESVEVYTNLFWVAEIASARLRVQSGLKQGFVMANLR